MGPRRLLPLLVLVSLVASSCAGSSAPKRTAGGKGTEDAGASGGTAAASPGASPAAGSARERASSKKGAADDSPEQPALNPPRTGRYPLKASAAVAKGPVTKDKVVFVFPPRRVKGLLQQIIAVGYPDGHHDMGTKDLWRAAGVYREREQAGADLCTYPKPILVMRLPLRVGDAWTSSAHCTDQASTRTYNVRVDRTETVKVGGEDVDTFVLQMRITRRSDDGKDTVLEETHWFSERYRLRVKRVVHVEGAPGLEVVEELTTTTPEDAPVGTPPPKF